MVEPWIVIPVVDGSSPFSHPIFPSLYSIIFIHHVESRRLFGYNARPVNPALAGKTVIYTLVHVGVSFRIMLGDQADEWKT